MCDGLVHSCDKLEQAWDGLVQVLERLEQVWDKLVQVLERLVQVCERFNSGTKFGPKTQNEIPSDF